LKTRDHPERGRLPAATRPDEGNEFAAVDLEVEAIDGDHMTERLAQLLELELSHGRTPLVDGRRISRLA
jgi:hypothetical protein